MASEREPEEVLVAMAAKDEELFRPLLIFYRAIRAGTRRSFNLGTCLREDTSTALSGASAPIKYR
jgi:hypothetical protein